jgi:hypothetical protein
MTEEQRPKVEGKNSRQPARPPKKEFMSNGAGLKTYMFDIGNAKYAAKYKKSLNAITNYAQREYKGGPEIAKAWRDLVLPTITVPTCLIAKTGGQVGLGEVFLWQQEVQETTSETALCPLLP